MEISTLSIGDAKSFKMSVVLSKLALRGKGSGAKFKIRFLD